MYETKTMKVLHDQMLTETPADIDKREGSITYDMTAPAAGRAAEIYVELDNILALGFADTAVDADNETTDWLGMRTSEMGVDRKPAVQATGQLTFTGPSGTVIPVGTRASTNSSTPIYFVTTIEGTIPVGGSITLSANCEMGGLIGNVGASTITTMIGNLAGTVTVTNSNAFSGGVDKESNQALLDRYLERVRKPATSGNSNHYLAWAKEVVGVGDAKCFPTWNGNGTVKVVIIDSEKTGADAALVTSTTTYIQSVMPVGPTLTVISATEVAINISATLVLKAGSTLASAKTEIEGKVKDYLKSLAFVDSVVRYNQISSLILDCESIVDHSNLTMNGATTNVNVTVEQVAVLGTVTVV